MSSPLDKIDTSANEPARYADEKATTIRKTSIGESSTEKEGQEIEAIGEKNTWYENFHVKHIVRAAICALFTG